MKGLRHRSDSDRVLPLSTNIPLEDDNDIQTCLAPYIQTYLSHSSTNDTCGCLPVPFERAAPLSWLRPSFDSDILEGQFKSSSNEHFTHRFRYALAYILGVSTVWLAYSSYRYPQNPYTPFLFAVLAAIMAITFYITFRDSYQQHSQLVAIVTALFLVFSCLVFCVICPLTLSHFAMVCYTILVIYTIFPLPPYVCLLLCLGLTAGFHVLEYYVVDTRPTPIGFFIRLLSLFCVNIIGFHIVVMVNVRGRGTFMKVGQRLLVRRQLEAEKQLKEKMIHSVMPPKVASRLLNPNPSLSGSEAQERNSTGDIRAIFRPFNMFRMENVSILFADIVGFTRMSSNKTAEEIVDILNDLFERFDELCMLSGCEKISTLGDCYYCVSGCPEPRDDHARCCVEMGLGMIDAIQEFDVERSEDVNMRVGVHTGTVFCGVVGTRRFKFDVWSNDVTFANKLESTGVAGRVHVSQSTVNFLDGLYKLDDYEASLDVKTYLIATRIAKPSSQVRVALPSAPPTPQNVSIHSSNRIRLNSCNASKKPHYLSLITDVRSKFSSLPNVFESGKSSPNQLPRKSTSIKSHFPFTKSWRQNSPETITLGTVERSNSIQRLELPNNDLILRNEEEISLCPSMNSRKDSGIRSASRRSSIQQQLYFMNGMTQQSLLTHRVSGYFTTSRSSIPHSESDCDLSEPCRPPAADSLGHCFYSLRKQSDLQLIRCVRDISERSYFVKVPLHFLSMRFRSAKVEADYRRHAYEMYDSTADSPTTLSTTRYNTYLDILVSTLVLTSVTVGLIALSSITPLMAVVLVFSMCMQLSVLVLFSLCLSQHFGQSTLWRRKFVDLLSNCYPWHIIGGILIALPIVLSLTGFATAVQQNKSNFTNTHGALNFLQGNDINLPDIEFFDFYFTFLVFASLIHFCNFTQLNFFMKCVIAIVSILIFISLIFIEQCQLIDMKFVSTVFIGKFINENVFVNESLHLREVSMCCEPLVDIISQLREYNVHSYFDRGSEFLEVFFSSRNGTNAVFYVTENGFKFIEVINQLMERDSWKDELLSTVADFIRYDRYELVLNVIIIAVLIVILNREFEISYRASYFFNVESNRDKANVQYLKNQADMLLENIIPKHVSIELKNRAKYCENHTDVAIIFASIVNFSKFYDETFSGGKEYLRYLNELISDFDELLSMPGFRNIEKIKTIGSTFMAASGLNPELRKQNSTQYEHIYELMEFAKEMYKVVHEFNKALLGFKLILRVGFNIGEVTAGVIGSSKLLYDIWGDTVNVASRMDSTGVEGRIQVPYSCLKYLGDKYQFEPRGSVSVKGKGDIMVYLLKT